MAKNGQEVPDVTAKKVTQVAVDREALKFAMERSGIDDPVKLVNFALRPLTSPDHSAAFARETRGSIPGFDLDI